jgi:hypothetical protein
VEAEPGSDGDQPARNKLTNRNGNGGEISPDTIFHSGYPCLKKRIAPNRNQSKKQQLLTRKKVNIYQYKTLQQNF